MRLAAASSTTDERLNKCFHSLSLTEIELMQSYGIHRNISTLCLHRMSSYMSQCFVTPCSIRELPDFGRRLVLSCEFIEQAKIIFRHNIYEKMEPHHLI